MFFVFFPIDVILVDGKKRVVELKQNFRPFTFFTSRNLASFAIEAPAGFVRREKIAVGDTIIFK